MSLSGFLNRFLIDIFRKKGRGQASIEFMSIMAIALSLLVMVTMISIGREQTIVSEREDLLAWRIAMTAAKEINLATSFGNGYERNFTLPPRILTTGYNFSVSNQSLLLTIRWRNYQIYEQITTPNISTVPRSGNNRIRNENGVIIID